MLKLNLSYSGLEVKLWLRLTEMTWLQVPKIVPKNESLVTNLKKKAYRNHKGSGQIHLPFHIKKGGFLSETK